ncbi:hypothetical protein B4N89_40980 [Embleya scabrispora]|uniref:Uncharacterized protein n=1 Tax=Embleya scabrispora TaxID=159449 RepID=A0A1T3NJQ0_9ACTN|nr:hypothetical protein B4N89_40980 [Embleya scabrispora]
MPPGRFHRHHLPRRLLPRHLTQPHRPCPPLTRSRIPGAVGGASGRGCGYCSRRSSRCRPRCPSEWFAEGRSCAAGLSFQDPTTRTSRSDNGNTS